MKTIAVGSGSYLVGEDIEVGTDVRFGANTVIRSMSIRIGDHTSFGDRNRVVAGDAFAVGANTFVGDDNHIEGRRVTIGRYVWWGSGVEVGHGGRFGPDSTLSVGAYTMICDRVILNLSEQITIGEFVGIGGEVNIWTHGAYLPTLEGFPCDFGPVSIGNRVWLPARSVVLPNRSIGDNVVIGINSLINRNIPSNCLAAGIPIKILKENVYPNVSVDRDRAFIQQVLARYRSLCAYKGLAPHIEYDGGYRVAVNGVRFDLQTLQVDGELSALEEDFRDFLRRNGIKFFTGRNFASIPPPNIKRLLEEQLGADDQ